MQCGVPEHMLKLMVNFRDARESARDLLELLGIEYRAAALHIEPFGISATLGNIFEWRRRNLRRCERRTRCCHSAIRCSQKN